MNRRPESDKTRARELAAEYAGRGDSLGWFEALYSEAGGELQHIPWADLEPNRFFVAWAEAAALRGDGRRALVVGCGLGDDARYLYDLGFDVTAFDISPTAIDWARTLHRGTGIRFEVANLFEPFPEWIGGFTFVLEVYTVQPLPAELREQAIDSVAAFVAEGGDLVVVTRGREDDDELGELPWPLSRSELARFEENGLVQTGFKVVEEDGDPAVSRFVASYRRMGAKAYRLPR